MNEEIKPSPDCAIRQRKYNWYNSYQFPLIPRIEKRLGNEYNTPSFSFKWLFIKIWSLDAFQFEVSIVADTHWGIGITALLPYLRVAICLPCPIRLQSWIQKHLWRRPLKQHNL